MMKIRTILLNFLLFILIASCTQTTPGTRVEFKVLVQSDNQIAFGVNSGFYPETSPVVMVATLTSEKELIHPYLYEEFQEPYQASYPSDSAYFAVFMGDRKPSGARITVKSITINRFDVYVVVELAVDTDVSKLDPAAGTRSPFQVVSIPMSSFPIERPVRVHLIDNDSGEEIATTEYPAP